MGALVQCLLENGARLYLDVEARTRSTQPPSATPSTTWSFTTRRERILEDLLKAAEARLREEGISGDIYLFKNNTDSAGNSYGSHENYLVSRYGEFGRLSEVMIPFFVSPDLRRRGKVLQTARGALWPDSQRAEHIWEACRPQRRGPAIIFHNSRTQTPRNIAVSM